MTRAQRRYGLRQIDREVRRQQQALLAQVRRIRREAPYPGETIEETLAMVVEAIRDIEQAPSVVTGPALSELHALHDDLITRLRPN